MREYWKSGDPFVWLAGAMLGMSIVMVAGLVTLILMNGLGFFWPRTVERFALRDGSIVIGEVAQREMIPDPGALSSPARYRLQVKRGNRDLYGSDFLWIDEAAIAKRDVPEEVVVLERREWGNFYGLLASVRHADRTVATGSEPAWSAVEARLPEANRLHDEIRAIEKNEIGTINYTQERARLALRRLELEGVTRGPRVEALERRIDELRASYDKTLERLGRLRQAQNTSLAAVTADGRAVEVPFDKIVRAFRPNRMGGVAK